MKPFSQFPKVDFLPVILEKAKKQAQLLSEPCTPRADFPLKACADNQHIMLWQILFGLSQLYTELLTAWPFSALPPTSTTTALWRSFCVPPPSWRGKQCNLSQCHPLTHKNSWWVLFLHHHWYQSLLLTPRCIIIDALVPTTVFIVGWLLVSTNWWRFSLRPERIDLKKLFELFQR